jgi:hypothetical protein
MRAAGPEEVPPHACSIRSKWWAQGCGRGSAREYSGLAEVCPAVSSGGRPEIPASAALYMGFHDGQMIQQSVIFRQSSHC